MKEDTPITISGLFEDFASTIAVRDMASIDATYRNVTRCLNKKYYQQDSDSEHSEKVGSVGRGTCIRGISDLDMLFILPDETWVRFRDNRQSALLQEVKNVLLETYPRTDIRGDGQVVVVPFSHMHIEIVPGFQEISGDVTYPDTHNGGTWKTTKPQEEIRAIHEFDNLTYGNLRIACMMIRAWKNKVGMKFGGLLIDTLVYRFFRENEKHRVNGYAHFPTMVRDLFKFLCELPEQSFFFIFGSNQKVYVTSKFQHKAKKALDLCEKALVEVDVAKASKKWRKVFGRHFPLIESDLVMSKSEELRTDVSFRNTEEFIEDRFDVDIRYDMEIDCEVHQDGFLPTMLSRILNGHESSNYPRRMLLPTRRLVFKIIKIDVKEKYEIYWKVLNRGEEAERRDCIRGQIISGGNTLTRQETSNFRGGHKVEAYAVADSVVVARARIDVPIHEVVYDSR